jgi:sulfite reductase (ferredoxin)
MTSSSTPPHKPAGPAKPAPSGPGRSGRPRPRRGEGQWALGYREPLNANEQFKKDDDALNVRARIENIYSRRGFDSIDPNDLSGRFRWWGLYTQRRQGLDGGKTGALEPHELDDEYFMLRVRTDGGQLDLAQLRTLADVATTYARDTRTSPTGRTSSSTGSRSRTSR